MNSEVCVPIRLVEIQLCLYMNNYILKYIKKKNSAVKSNNPDLTYKFVCVYIQSIYTLIFTALSKIERKNVY